MGVSTNCKIAFYSKEKELVKKHDLEGRADDFIYALLNDGGSTFEPTKIGKFSEEQIEIMKIYFDKESGSVCEGYAKVTPNIQDPKALLKIWNIIQQHITVTFEKRLKDYRNSLLGTNKPEEIPNPKIEIDEHQFNRILFDYTWSLHSISKIIAGLEIAIQNDYLVEITVSDW